MTLRDHTRGEFDMIVYGLSTCATCQKARKALHAEGVDVRFRDVRAEPLSEAELAELIAEFGDRLVDRTSSDYRGLSNWLKNSEAEAQISAQPKVMARPVIRDGSVYYLGWDESVRNALLVSLHPGSTTEETDD
jgi:arsenate reductase (glutaredoxin)